jgi:hypothetical protein
MRWNADSVWTYFVTDNPFGSEADRVLSGARRAMRTD